MTPSSKTVNRARTNGKEEPTWLCEVDPRPLLEDPAVHSDQTISGQGLCSQKRSHTRKRVSMPLTSALAHSVTCAPPLGRGVLSFDGRTVMQHAGVSTNGREQKSLAALAAHPVPHLGVSRITPSTSSASGGGEAIRYVNPSAFSLSPNKTTFFSASNSHFLPVMRRHQRMDRVATNVAFSLDALRDGGSFYVSNSARCLIYGTAVSRTRGGGLPWTGGGDQLLLSRGFHIE